MRMFIMRHARYTYSLTDYQKLKDGPMPSAEGMKETTAMAKKLASRGFSTVYTNSANRSKIPARIIAKTNNHHPRVIIDHHIDPMKVDYTGSDIVAHVKSAKTRSRTGQRWVQGELPSIEPLGDFMARVSRFLVDVAARHDSKDDVLVIAHWETFAAMNAILNGMPVEKAMKAHDSFKYNHLYAFEI